MSQVQSVGLGAPVLLEVASRMKKAKFKQLVGFFSIPHCLIVKSSCVSDTMERQAKDCDAMSVTIGPDQVEESFVFDVSDEALESAAGARSEIAVRYTLYACTSVDCALVPK